MRIALPLITLFIASFAFAADPGTYRPGQAYHSAVSNSATNCSAICQNDSQCQGWNFVRAQPHTRSGVCELNARRAAPVSSPVSISGDSIQSYRSTAQIVSAGSRTVRVGSEIGYVAPPQNIPPSTRRIVSQPLPHRMSPVSATQRSVAPRISVPTHILDTAPQTRAPVRQAPYLKHNLDDAPLAQQPIQQAPIQQAEVKPQGVGSEAQRVERPIAQPKRPIPTNAVRPSIQPSVPPNTPSRPSLFGSLHDDVKVPRPLGPGDIPEDSNVPIPTVTSVPTKDVMTDKIYGMAGPNPR